MIYVEDKCIPGETKFLSRTYWTSELAMWSYSTLEKCFTLPYIRTIGHKTIIHRTIVVDHAMLYIVTVKGSVISLLLRPSMKLIITNLLVGQVYALSLYQDLSKMSWTAKAPVTNEIANKYGTLIQYKRELVYFARGLKKDSIKIYSISDNVWTTHGPLSSTPGGYPVLDGAIHLPGNRSTAILHYNNGNVALFDLQLKETTRVLETGMREWPQAMCLHKGTKKEKHGLLVQKRGTTELHFLDFADFESGFNLLASQGMPGKSS